MQAGHWLPICSRCDPPGTLIVEIHDHRPPSSSPLQLPSPSQAKYGFLSLSSFPAVAAQAAAPAPGTLAEVYRVVLWPNDESLYTDLRNWDRREECNWSDDEVARVEAGVLVSSFSPAVRLPDVSWPR